MSFRPPDHTLAAAALLCLFCFASCNRECCDCTDSEIYRGTFCEDELPANFSSWEGCRTALKEGGCKCD
ncbi:MAG: hypothetical protein K9J06_02275 [Flavobacteriales bacterium]|nr:hypothetical protein [Flavobacteriales bacterium]